METALVAVVYDLMRNLDSVPLLVLIALSVVFDTINYGIHLGYLSDLGVGGTVLQWISSFLSGWSQKVVVEECSSAT